MILVNVMQKLSGVSPLGNKNALGAVSGHLLLAGTLDAVHLVKLWIWDYVICFSRRRIVVK